MTFNTDTLKELVGAADLSEDAVLKIKLMIETTIQEKVEAAKTELTQAHEAALAEAQAASAAQVEELTRQIDEATEAHEAELADLTEKANEYAQYVVAEMTEKIDSYAEYVVEKFIEDNKQTLVESEEYARMKRVFSAIQEAFAGACFELTPKDGVAELEASLKEAKDAYNDVFSKLQTALSENEEMQYAMVFESLTKDLAETQKEKLKALVENVSFDSIAEFKRGVELMIGQVAESTKSATDGDDASAAIVEDASAAAAPAASVTKPANEAMKRYLKVL